MNDLTAYDLYLRALATYYPITRERNLEALGLLRQAIAIDRHHGPALSLAAMCHMRLFREGWAEEPETTSREGVDLARQALQVAEDDPGILVNAAFVLASFGEDICAMMGLIDRALVLTPSFSRGWFLSGVVLLWAGQHDLAIEHAQTALRLSPRERMGTPLSLIGEAHFFKREFDQAAAKLLLSISEPSWLSPHLPRSRRVLRPYGASRRSALDRRAAARHYPAGRAELSAFAQPRGPRAVSVGPAPGSRRGGTSRTRRLAAIRAADVVGYSRLTGADEEGSLERLKALRRELLDPKIAEPSRPFPHLRPACARVRKRPGAEPRVNRNCTGGIIMLKRLMPPCRGGTSATVTAGDNREERGRSRTKAALDG